MSLKVELIPIFDDNYVFAVRSGTQALIVDPGAAGAVVTWMETNRLRPAGILLTHHHHDHIGGVAELRTRYPGLPVWAPLKNKTQIPDADVYVDDGDTVTAAGLHFAVIGLPGHTLGHIAYHEAAQNWLFSGDVLFGLGCGRIFEGTFEQAYESLQKIKALPAATEIFCAHEYTAANLRFLQSLGPLSAQQRHYAENLRLTGSPSVPLSLQSEKNCNPFLLAPDAAEFARLRGLRNVFR